MDVAAQKVQKLSIFIPDQPHQLAFAIDKRYPVHTQKSRGWEETIYPGLQYMTFVSDLERGVLMTRSYDDMRDEPLAPNATPKQPNSPARIDKKPSTKISLSDYKNKVKKLSQSPPPPAMSSKVDDSLRIPPTRNLDQKRKDGALVAKDMRDGKPQGLKDPLFQDRPSSLPPKPPVPVRDFHDSSDRRKRPAEDDDATRPPKRSRPDVNGASQDKARTPKHEGIRNGSADANRKKESGLARVRSPRPESRSSNSLEPNGRSMLKTAMNPNRTGSPDSRPRATSLNGIRPNSSGSARSTTPSKPTPVSVSTSKPSLPPLLSPLHLGPFNDSEISSKSEKFRRDNGIKSQKEKPDKTGPGKRGEDRVAIPPLLSPTLPPMLEAELARRKKVPNDMEYRSRRDRSPKSPKSPIASKKPRAIGDAEEAAPRKSLIVTLKYNKRIAKSVQRLLALYDGSERSTSIDSQPNPAPKKRPAPSSGGGGTITVEAPDSMAAKRPRNVVHSRSSSKTLGPSTPSRAMGPAHHVNTPGELLPEPPSQRIRLASVPPNVEALKQRFQRYVHLGTSLKHKRDGVVKNFPPTNDGRVMPDTELKLSTVMGIEAILSYMVGFNAMSEARYLEKKPKDYGVWKSLLPLVNELQLSVRDNVFPKAILSILQERVLQEIISGLLLAGDLRNQSLLQDLHRHGRDHDKVKRHLPAHFRKVEEANEDMAGPTSQLPVIYSGEPAEQVVSKTLLAVKSWASRERVDWEPALSTDNILSGT